MAVVVAEEWQGLAACSPESVRSEAEEFFGGLQGTLRRMFGNPEFVAPVITCLDIDEQLLFAKRMRVVAKDFCLSCRLGDDDCPLWHVLVQSLCEQRKLWLPEVVRAGTLLPGVEGGWKSLYEDLLPLKERFVYGSASNSNDDGGQQTTTAATAIDGPQPQPQPPSRSSTTFRIASFCRFRPSSERQAIIAAAAGKAGGGVTGVTLPLHQRVALLRRSHPELSHKEAVAQVIATQRAQKQQQQIAEAQSGGSCQGGFASSIVSVTPGHRGSVLTVSPGCGLRPFEFGHVFDGASKQSDLYDQCGLKLVVDLVNGVNGAVILYGQTGSGKTHTMFGPAGSETESKERGLAPRVAESLVAALVERRELGLDVQLFMSFVEVFGNQVTDLLGGLRVGDTEARRVFSGEFAVPIESTEDVSSALAQGNERKRCAETAMNDRSTRAHSLVVFRMVQQKKVTDASEPPAPPISSQLFLADLGGSERVSKSRANDTAKTAGFAPWSEYYESRQRLTEARNINQGLLALKRCIQAFDDRQRTGKAIPIPYRDSRLTEMLEPALGGLSRTSIVVCCSPEVEHSEETVQTLRFGEMCSSIEHVHSATADMTSGVIVALRQLDEEIEGVQQSIREKERWEWRQQVRRDIVDANDESTARVNTGEEMELGGLGAVEFLPDDPSNADNQEVEHTVWGQVLVGAEEEHQRLEALLEQRRQLLGEA
mmetsp:Transcript_61707/g.130222  ORF Transcript_61707/g.130222 Transcript_61707/m.130222 type:complete len:711 (-) Transcript_61707:743-2875(-)